MSVPLKFVAAGDILKKCRGRLLRAGGASAAKQFHPVGRGSCGRAAPPASLWLHRHAGGGFEALVVAHHFLNCMKVQRFRVWNVRHTRSPSRRLAPNSAGVKHVANSMHAFNDFVSSRRDSVKHRRAVVLMVIGHFHLLPRHHRTACMAALRSI